MSSLAAMALAPRARAAGVGPPALRFPADFGAHPDSKIEWWYATGTLHVDTARPGDTGKDTPTEAPPQCGFQITFFRSRTPVATAHASRFAAHQLVFAHAALTDLAQRRLRHDQRLARSGFGIASAAEGDTDVVLRQWRMRRSGSPRASVYEAQMSSDSAGFGLSLRLASTQPVLLQGQNGFSQKGPAREQASHYYSQPQLDVSGTLVRDGNTQAVRGRAWLDHEWSDSLLAPQAVGWDWIGMNLLDGSALTAFRLRRADGSGLYAGGSFRAAADARAGTGAGAGAGAGTFVRNFAPDEVQFTAQRTWASASSGAVYPVQWKVDTPAGRFTVNALLDNQELDSRQSTGTIYWEGLSELLDERGQRVGLGYLEMTGYSGRPTL